MNKIAVSLLPTPTVKVGLSVPGPRGFPASVQIGDNEPIEHIDGVIKLPAYPIVPDEEDLIALAALLGHTSDFSNPHAVVTDDLPGLRDELNGLSNGIDGNANRLDVVEGDITGHDTRIGVNEGAISDHTTAIGTLDSNKADKTQLADYLKNEDVGTISITESQISDLGTYASLVDGKIQDAHIPHIAITDTFFVASEAEMDALDVQKGDIAIRSDLHTTFVFTGTIWTEMLTPTDNVLSVNTKTGAVTLTAADVGAATMVQVNAAIDDIPAVVFPDETDPEFTASPARSITAGDITNLGNLSGVNTGDQDLSDYAKLTDIPEIPAETDPVAVPLIDAHLADRDNPHEVTPAQIGAVTTNQLDAAIEGIVVEEHDLIAIAQLDAHKLANNPHHVTPDQIGAITTNQLDTALNEFATLTDLDDKADITYVNDRVKTDVPADAKFTDTIVDISGKADKSDVDELKLKAERLEQYGDAAIEPSPASWFTSSGGIITKFNWAVGREHVVIPYEHNGDVVTGIADGGWDDTVFGRTSIETVIAPKSLTLIGGCAFAWCANLTSVSLPSATSIGDSAFYCCANLTSVSLPSATSIGDSAFDLCDNLTSVSLPSVTSIGTYAFNWCANLTSVSLPSATSIRDAAFEGCANLTYLTLGKTPPSTWAAGILLNVTLYVPHDASSAYGTKWNGMAVIYATESADNFYVNDTPLSQVITPTYQTLTGSSPTIMPNGSYVWNALTNTANTLNVTGFAPTKDQTASLILTLGADATISSSGFTFVDIPEQGKTSHCFLRSMPSGNVKFFISYVEED